MPISKVKKRDGLVVRFKSSKIQSAIEKAMDAVGKEEENLATLLADKVTLEINQKYDSVYVPSVEDVQDMVEKVLMQAGQTEIAKAYILYRQKRAEIRRLKRNILGKADDSKLNVNGLLIAKSRYLQKDSSGNYETPVEMFSRVAKSIAAAEKSYGKTDEFIEEIENDFFEILKNLEFVPSGRIFANSGMKYPMLYSSFVLPIEDNMKSIFRALYDKALVQRLGGGTGFSFSKIRPKGDILSTSYGYASGPIAFIKLYDHASDLTVQVGNRKPANMGSLSVEHPDIIEFITMKDRGEINNFNVSVELTDSFMNAVINNEKYALKDPSTGKSVDLVDANNIFHLIVTMAWKTGDPGILFIDRINESNPLPSISRIETTDPCGDQLLLPYDAGNLGAINLSKFVRNKKIKWKHIEQVTNTAVRFLDNIVDVSKFPIKKVEDMVKSNRRIGLGVMGFADMLYKLGIPYNSEKALETADKVMKYIAGITFEASESLALEKGIFPLWDKSIYKDKMKLRNCSLLAISPSGSRSILVDTSPGIEPNFALGYTRKVMGSIEILQINNVVEDVLKEYDIHSEEILREITKTGLKNIQLPQNIKDIFVTAYDIEPEWHIKMQAVFQKYVDNAISKTINFKRNATIEDIKKSFLLAYETGCKGLTVYREGSLREEVISFGG